MFKKALNQAKWDNLKKENKSNPDFVQAIHYLMIPDRISFDKFCGNHEALEKTADGLLSMEDIVWELSFTPSLHHYLDPFHIPMGYPRWFIAAYPDVARWASKNMDNLQNTAPYKNLLKDNNLPLNSSNKIQASLLQKFILSYRQSASINLECEL